MRLILIATMLAGLLVSGTGRAAEPGPPYDPLGFENPLSPVMRAYRDLPQPEETLKLFIVLNIRWFVARDQIEDARRVRDVITAFYARILRDNPALALPFAEALGREATGHHLDVGAGALRVADPPELEAALGAMKEARLARYEGEETDRLDAALDALIGQTAELQAFPYDTRAPRSDSEVDQLWAAYFAGGGEVYLARLFDTLDDWPGRTCIEAVEQSVSGIGGAEAGNSRLGLCPPGARQQLAYLETTEYARHTMAKLAESDAALAATLRDYAQRRGGVAGGLVQAVVSGQASQ